MQGLPKPVQEFILGDERNQISSELSQKYRLHVDQAGAFEEAYLFMLLGTVSPDEFMARLTNAGIAPETVRGLATDVNERVFIPLRLKEQQGESVGRIPVVVAKPGPLPPPSLDYQPAAPVLPGSDVPVPTAPVAPQAPILSVPKPELVPAAPAPQAIEATPLPAPSQHAVQAMPGTAHPGWHPAAAVHIYVPTQGPHLPSQGSVETPVASVPVNETPVATAPAYAEPQQVYIPPPAPNAAPAPYIPPAAAPTPITKGYPADPYREPVE